MANRSIGVLTLSGALVMLVGCGGSQTPLAAPGAIQQGPSIAIRTKGDLLYVSSNGFYVYMYSYPKGQLVGRISGLVEPLGECVDASGDVFITAFSGRTSTSSSIYKYPHGGITPIATLRDPGHAFGCSIDPTTGDLAVANQYDPSNPYNIAYGSVAIYEGAHYGPTMYYPSEFGVIACGYDNKGKLYLTVYGSQPGVAELARLSTGGRSFALLTLNATIYGNGSFPPGVQWDGKQMTVSSNEEDGAPVLLYRLSISGSKATVVGTTTLEIKKNHHEGQTWIEGHTVVGIFTDKDKGGVAFWAYPQGGNPKFQINHIAYRGQYTLHGVTISRGSQR